VTPFPATATKRDVWVELNDVDDRGQVVTFSDFADPGVTMARGAVVVAGDDEGNRARARVIDIQPCEGGPTRITLQLDLSPFRPSTHTDDDVLTFAGASPDRRRNDA
jgi:hypothetical protein